MATKITSRERVSDARLRQLIRQQITKGAETPQRALDMIREKGYAASLTRAEAAFAEAKKAERRERRKAS